MYNTYYAKMIILSVAGKTYFPPVVKTLTILFFTHTYCRRPIHHVIAATHRVKLDVLFNNICYYLSVGVLFSYT